jgi:hypothetical protein
MEPPAGFEPGAVHPTLRIGLEDRCRGQGAKTYLKVRGSKINSITYLLYYILLLFVKHFVYLFQLNCLAKVLLIVLDTEEEYRNTLGQSGV